MKLKKCPNCKTYTLKETCSKCNGKTKTPHYKFIKIRDAPKSSNPRKIRKK
jgi:rRNA maturation protein Nop10